MTVSEKRRNYPSVLDDRDRPAKKGEVVCAVSDCERVRKRRQYCLKHYARWRRNADLTTLGHAANEVGKDRAFKKAWVDNYKLEHGCADCGYNEPPAALDFDHRPGTKKIRNIKAGHQFGWLALLAEVAKCDVVCANCHRIRTVNRRHIPHK